MLLRFPFLPDLKRSDVSDLPCERAVTHTSKNRRRSPTFTPLQLVRSSFCGWGHASRTWNNPTSVSGHNVS